MDEIGELPAETQLALLRVLQESRSVRRHGYEKDIPTDNAILGVTSNMKT
jgi:transcriptional regulator with GAF, ATPase, and Fis domain